MELLMRSTYQYFFCVCVGGGGGGEVTREIRLLTNPNPEN